MAQPQTRGTPEREAARDTTEQELSAVLGRFRAWNADSANTLNPANGHAHNPALDSPPETDTILREITYEEALGARRKASLPSSLHQKSPRAIRSASAAAPAPAPPRERKRNRPIASVAPRQQMATPRSRPGPKSDARPASAKQSAESPVRFTGPAGPRTAAPRQSPARPGPSRSARASFQQVMQESLANNMSKSQPPNPPSRALVRATVNTDPNATPEEKSFAVKLRASPRDFAMIQAGASEAGVTIAEYMRQCTLDVQLLRALLNQTIAERNLASIAGAPSSGTGAGEQISYDHLEPENDRSTPLDTEDTLVSRLKTLFFGTKKSQGSRKS